MTGPDAGQHGGHHLPADFRGPVRLLAAASRALAVVEGLAIALALTALIVVALWQSVARTLHMGLWPAFPPAPDWTNGLLRHAVFIIGFTGAMYATYTGRHLRVDALTRLTGVRGRLLLRVLGVLGALVVCGAVIYWAWLFRESVKDENGQAGQIFDAARGALILVVGVGGIAFHFLVQLCIDLTYLLGRREVPGWWIAEASHGTEVGATDDDDAPGLPL